MLVDGFLEVFRLELSWRLRQDKVGRLDAFEPSRHLEAVDHDHVIVNCITNRTWSRGLLAYLSLSFCWRTFRGSSRLALHSTILLAWRVASLAVLVDSLKLRGLVPAHIRSLSATWLSSSWLENLGPGIEHCPSTASPARPQVGFGIAIKSDGAHCCYHAFVVRSILVRDLIHQLLLVPGHDSVTGHARKSAAVDSAHNRFEIELRDMKTDGIGRHSELPRGEVNAHFHHAVGRYCASKRRDLELAGRRHFANIIVEGHWNFALESGISRVGDANGANAKVNEAGESCLVDDRVAVHWHDDICVAVVRTRDAQAVIVISPLIWLENHRDRLGHSWRHKAARLIPRLKLGRSGALDADPAALMPGVRDTDVEFMLAAHLVPPKMQCGRLHLDGRRACRRC
mmetsp:Transcript_10412/g.33276  ORF Transcript_10412/g.33276 Transcript_10412/m.33276 type:complete len:399 (-) Transcript_10412:309-1505(-)